MAKKPVRTTEPTEAEIVAADARRAVLREQLLRGQQRMAELRATGWKPTHRTPVEAAQAKPTSLKLAIKAFCWQCVGSGGDPGAKFRVRDCTAPSCSLFPHRPWQAAKGGIQMGEAGVAEPTAESEDTAED